VGLRDSTWRIQAPDRTQAWLLVTVALLLLCPFAWRMDRRDVADQAAPVDLRGTPRAERDTAARCESTVSPDCESCSVLRSIAASLSAPVADTHAIVEARVYDCSHQPVSGVQLEVWHALGDDFRYCTDCRIVYPGSTGAPDPTQTQFSSNSAAPAWTVLALRDFMFVARDVSTQRPISVLGPVTVRPGSLRLGLTPASAAQLATLPEKIRLGSPESRK
jgi:hypothetical protein